VTDVSVQLPRDTGQQPMVLVSDPHYVATQTANYVATQVRPTPPGPLADVPQSPFTASRSSVP
jgi:hypothetical protein